MPPRDMSIYEAARTRLNANEYINSMEVDEYLKDCLRGIQGTYEVRLERRLDDRYMYRIQLIWDHDCLRGMYELGTIKGVFSVDHGPGPEDFDVDVHEGLTSREFPLRWRGTSEESEGTLFEGLGAIRFGFGTISGNFDATGDSEDCYDFYGKTPRGPQLVSFSIKDFSNEWDETGICEEVHDRTEEVLPRSSTEDDSSNSTTSSDPSTSSHELEDQAEALRLLDGLKWTKEDQAELLRFLDGHLYHITSEDIAKTEVENPTNQSGIVFRIDRAQEIVWCRFRIGGEEGCLLLDLHPGELSRSTPMGFQWRTRRSLTGNRPDGRGQVCISKNGRNLQGVFRGMCGDVAFKAESLGRSPADKGRCFLDKWRSFAVEVGDEYHWYDKKHGWICKRYCGTVESIQKA